MLVCDLGGVGGKLALALLLLLIALSDGTGVVADHVCSDFDFCGGNGSSFFDASACSVVGVADDSVASGETRRGDVALANGAAAGAVVAAALGDAVEDVAALGAVVVVVFVVAAVDEEADAAAAAPLSVNENKPETTRALPMPPSPRERNHVLDPAAC